VTLPQVSAEVEAALDWDTRSTERLLIVLDSVNTMAELAQGGEGVETYFSELRRWLLWRWSAGARAAGSCRSSRSVRRTPGARRRTQGGLRRRHGRAHAPRRYGRVREVAVVKGRYSGRQDLGALYFDHHAGAFRGMTQGASSEPI